MSRQHLANLALLVAVFALIFGAKLRLIDRYGSDVPYWDQWDAEGENLYQAQSEGTLSAQNFFRPHNEHRPVFTRILALGLFDLDGHEWDPLLEQVVDALIHISLALLLLAFARRLLPPVLLVAFAAFTTTFFSMNLSWENTLSGFQSQFYFLALFSVLHLAGTLGTRPRSLAWWLAPLAGAATLFCMASGLLSALAILAITGLRVARDRKFTRDDLYIVAANVALAIAGWLLKFEVPGHAVLKAAGVGGWLDAWIHQLAWPITTHVGYWLWLGLFPPLAILVAFLRRRLDGPAALVLLGACAWVVMQTMAIAYARGGGEHGYSSRYTDNLALGVLINLLAVAYLAVNTTRRALRSALGAACAAIIIVSLWGLERESDTMRALTLEPMIGVQTARAETVREYIKTRDPEFYKKIPWDEVPYPAADRLASLLDRPAIRRTLPPSLTPGLALEPAAAAGTSAFSTEPTDLPRELPGPSPQKLVHWADLSMAPGEFRSTPFRVSRSRVSIFVAADPGLGGYTLRLVGANGVVLHPRQETVERDARWHRANFSAPPGEYTLAVDKLGGGWLRFTAPIEDTPLSRDIRALVRDGNVFTTIGILVGMLAVGLWWSASPDPKRFFGDALPQPVARPQPFAHGANFSRAAVLQKATLAVRSGRVRILTAMIITGVASVLARPRTPDEATFLSTLSEFGFTGSIYLILAVPAARWLDRRQIVSSEWTPLLATGVVAGIGYILFWIFFFGGVTAGKAATVVLFVGGVAAWGSNHGRPLPRIYLTAFLLQLAVGGFYICCIFLHASHADLYTLTANSIIPGMPEDNRLPHELATRIFGGLPVRPFAGDWLSSDRPPLEAAWQLLPWTGADLLNLPRSTTSGAASFWFQLSWVPAVLALLINLGVRAARAAWWTAVLSLTGFFFFNSVYVWPKLSAGAFCCGTFGLWVLNRERGISYIHSIRAGAFLLALAWLSHGGMAFSALPLLGWALVDFLRGRRLDWLGAGLIFCAALAPWLYYQHSIDPPADRLLKMHLGGQVEITTKSTWATIRDNYAQLSLPEIFRNKMVNVHMQVPDPWLAPLGFDAKSFQARRAQQFFHTGAALSWWLIGILAAPFLSLLPSRRQNFDANRSAYRATLAWVLSSLVLWWLLMFGRLTTAVVHQGSYAIMLGSFALLSAWLEALGSSILLVPLGLLQLTTLVTVFLLGQDNPGPLQPLPLLVGGMIILLCSVQPIRSALGRVAL